MGKYLNPGSGRFREAVSSQIYVDKTGLIQFTNACLHTEQKYICVSRPRRFGKSITANMLAAYYGQGEDSETLFAPYEIARSESSAAYRNHFHVILLNMQNFLSRSKNVTQMLEKLCRTLLRELFKAYPDVEYEEKTDLIEVLQDIYSDTGIAFVFIIDEWDCIFRERKNSVTEQREYLDFLRLLLKDQNYVALAYMTGILPIKKYGTHSALNMFTEYSMTNPGRLASYVGFTESEVRQLCARYHMDFSEAKRWYDGYHFEQEEAIYSPQSVVSAMLGGCYDSYWNQTETFDALRTYIVLNFDGLQDAVMQLLAGDRLRIDTGSFSNDMTTFHSRDDVLTLLIHLGYLAYNFNAKEVYIPNSEVEGIFATAVKLSGWSYAAKAIEESNQLLQAIWEQDAATVAKGIEAAHLDTPSLTFNSENALACTISLALFAARDYYHTFRELPSGKGFTDIVYIPRINHPDKPALVVELKWNQSAQGAIHQILEKQYPAVLKDFPGEILLVGINYDRKTKQHQCRIETYSSYTSV